MTRIPVRSLRPGAYRSGLPNGSYVRRTASRFGPFRFSLSVGFGRQRSRKLFAVKVGLLRLRIEVRISLARRRGQISISAHFQQPLPSFGGVPRLGYAGCDGAEGRLRIHRPESRPTGSMWTSVREWFDTRMHPQDR